MRGWKARINEAGAKVAATYSKPVVRCRRCSKDIDLTAQTAGAYPYVTWGLDLRQTLVRCPKCKQFVLAFVYPLFNWIPPTRAVAELVALSTLLVLSSFLVASRTPAKEALQHRRPPAATRSHTPPAMRHNAR
jgi:hypothetical protein